MPSSTRWPQFVACLSLLALCLFVAGCGGGSVDAIIAEEKALMQEMKSGKMDAQAIQKRQADIAAKVNALSQSQKEDYLKRKLADIGDMFKDIKIGQ